MLSDDMDRGKSDDGLVFMSNAMAFGDGRHPSTILALDILSMVANEYDDGRLRNILNILDMGCGSGILSLAAAHHFPDSDIVAADISRESAEKTLINVRENGLENRIMVVRSDGYKSNKITQYAPYDMIISNILADTLISWAPETSKHLCANGLLILSGILNWRCEEVMEAYRANGFSPVLEMQADDWAGFLMIKDI